MVKISTVNGAKNRQNICYKTNIFTKNVEKCWFFEYNLKYIYINIERVKNQAKN